MDYTICTSSVKGKSMTKLVITPTNSLEREFFNQLFSNKGAIIETVTNSEDIVLTRKEENGTKQSSTPD